MTKQPSASPAFREQLKDRIFSALRQNALPGLFLQIFAGAIALSYFFIPEARSAFDALAAIKARYDWQYAFIATAIFGGLIPCLYLISTRKITEAIKLNLIFYVVFWAIKGVEVNYFYALQGYWFGNEVSLRVIAIKTSLDQFIYSAFWAVPGIILIYLWKDNNFSFDAWKKAISKELFLVTIPAAVASNWLIWIPAVSLIYAMPPALQLPLFNLVLCFYVLIVSAISQPQKSTSAAIAAAN